MAENGDLAKITKFAQTDNLYSMHESFTNNLGEEKTKNIMARVSVKVSPDGKEMELRSLPFKESVEMEKVGLKGHEHHFTKKNTYKSMAQQAKQFQLFSNKSKLGKNHPPNLL
jgi:hypothetical protein